MEYHSEEALWWHHCIFKWLWQGRTRVTNQRKHAPGQLLPTSPQVQLWRLHAICGVLISGMSMQMTSLTRWSPVLAQWHRHDCQTATLLKITLTLLEDTSKPHQCFIQVLMCASDREYQSECLTWSNMCSMIWTCAVYSAVHVILHVYSVYVYNTQCSYYITFSITEE